MRLRRTDGRVSERTVSKMETIFISLVQYLTEVRNLYDRGLVLVHAERAEGHLVGLTYGTRAEQLEARLAYRNRPRVAVLDQAEVTS